MRKGILFIVLFVGILCPLFASEDGAIVLQAVQDADADGKLMQYPTWFFSSFALSMFTTPLLGGVGMVVLSYADDEQILSPRLATAYEKYPNTDDMVLYKSLYEERLSDIARDKKRNAAVIGAGAAAAFYAVVSFLIYLNY